MFLLTIFNLSCCQVGSRGQWLHHLDICGFLILQLTFPVGNICIRFGHKFNGNERGGGWGRKEKGNFVAV